MILDNTRAIVLHLYRRAGTLIRISFRSSLDSPYARLGLIFAGSLILYQGFPCLSCRCGRDDSERLKDRIWREESKDGLWPPEFSLGCSMGRSFESMRRGVKDVSARWLMASRHWRKSVGLQTEAGEDGLEISDVDPDILMSIC